MAFDPHHNIFHYYRGPTTSKVKNSNKGKRVDVQLENNTTKALINTLKYCTSEVCIEFLNHFFQIEINKNEDNKIRFALQKQTIGEQKINLRNTKILWGIFPRLYDSVDKKNHKKEKVERNPPSMNNNSSIPDAWIWDNDIVILIECKINSKFDEDQMKRHEKKLLPKPIRKETYWEDIHFYFKNKK